MLAVAARFFHLAGCCYWPTADKNHERGLEPKNFLLLICMIVESKWADWSMKKTCGTFRWLFQSAPQALTNWCERGTKQYYLNKWLKLNLQIRTLPNNNWKGTQCRTRRSTQKLVCAWPGKRLLLGAGRYRVARYRVCLSCMLGKITLPCSWWLWLLALYENTTWKPCWTCLWKLPKWGKILQ